MPSCVAISASLDASSMLSARFIDRNFVAPDMSPMSSTAPRVAARISSSAAGASLPASRWNVRYDRSVDCVTSSMAIPRSTKPLISPAVATAATPAPPSGISIDVSPPRPPPSIRVMDDAIAEPICAPALDALLCSVLAPLTTIWLACCIPVWSPLRSAPTRANSLAASVAISIPLWLLSRLCLGSFQRLVLQSIAVAVKAPPVRKLLDGHPAIQQRLDRRVLSLGQVKQQILQRVRYERMPPRGRSPPA